MEQFIVTCCSTADMSAEYFEQRHIPYVCFHYLMDGTLYPDDLGKTMSFDVFYQRISAGAMPTTSQVNTEQFWAFWEPMLKEGKDILHVCLSSGLSGVSNSAQIAQREMSERYPERQIIVVDSLGASSGYGMLVDAIADLRDAGVSLAEAAKWAEENKLHVHHWFFSTDLTSYWRGGRLSRTSATIANVFNISPLLNMDAQGHLTPRFKIQGKNRVIKAMVQKMEELANGGLEYDGKCFMSMSACYDDARKVADLIEAKFPSLNGKVVINNVGTVIGAHTGPGTVALFFFGTLRN
ncbi:MAG: DegV family protein [Clostridia bacterium]